MGEDYGPLLDLGNGRIATYFPGSSVRATVEARVEWSVDCIGKCFRLNFLLKGSENILKPLNCVPQPDAFDYNLSSPTDAVSLGES